MSAKCDAIGAALVERLERAIRYVRGNDMLERVIRVSPQWKACGPQTKWVTKKFFYLLPNIDPL